MLWCFQLIFWVGALTTCSALTFDDSAIQDAVSALWSADTNRAANGQVVVDFQDHTNGGDRTDNAPDNLFRKVDQALLKKPTYQALIDLFDAYDSSSSTYGAKVDAFMTKISATGVYKALQQFLASKGYAPAKSDSAFRKAITDIWFGDYSRSGSGQSSGFEHVFIGEVKNGQVSGLHNWVRLYHLEQQGELDYTGFIVKRPRVAILQYRLGNAWKPTGSVLIGTSPEFEFATFTLCFLGKQGENACRFFLGDCTPVDVSSYPYNVRGNIFIGTVFPSPGRTNERCPL